MKDDVAESNFLFLLELFVLSIFLDKLVTTKS